MSAHVLAVDPGSTSTKIALFADDDMLLLTSIEHADDELRPLRSGSVLDQLGLRLDAVLRTLRDGGFHETTLDAVVGRGGLLRPLSSGTYAVTDAMIADLRAAARGEHASNLGAFLARELAARGGCPAFVVDPVSVDEWDDVARLSGLAGLDRECLSHALNTKAVARRFAREQGRTYEELRLVVAHLGSGISVSAHRDGRMVDVNNSREEGPFSTERAGSVPVMKLLRRAIDEGWTRPDAERRLFREGGLVSYLGTRDLREIERRIDAGDETARGVLEAMLYQVMKEAGAMAACLRGRVDAVLLTGGLAHSERITATLSSELAWLAPVHVYPGEDELRALAEGALRVLRGESVPFPY